MKRRGNPETPIVAAAMKSIPHLFPGAKFWRANSGGNKSGRKHNSINLVDIVGWQQNGMALAIEVKNEEGSRCRLTLEQADFLSDVNLRGGYAGLFTPRGLFVWGEIPEKHLPRTARMAK